MIHKVIVPKSRVVNLSFTVPQNYVGEEMEVIAFMKKEGLQSNEPTEQLSPALSGAPLTNQEFIKWISNAEEMRTISLQEAQTKWTNKRSQLEQLIK